MAFGQLLGAALGGAALLSGRRAVGRTPAAFGQQEQMLAQLMPIGQQAQQYAQALVDPNSQLLQQLSSEEEQQQRRSFLSGLQDLVNQNRRLQGMGRAPLFDPERGSENIYRAVQMGLTDAQMQGRQRARERLLGGIQGFGNAANIMSGAASGFGNLGAMQQQQNINRGMYNLSLGQFGVEAAPTIGNFLTSLRGRF